MVYVKNFNNYLNNVELLLAGKGIGTFLCYEHTVMVPIDTAEKQVTIYYSGSIVTKKTYNLNCTIP